MIGDGYPSETNGLRLGNNITDTFNEFITVLII